MQNAMGGSAKCKISIEDGRPCLRADYSAHPRNLARNARVFGIALPRGAGGASPGKGRTKPPQSHPKATPKPIDLGRTSNIHHPTSEPEQRFTAEKPQESDLDKLA